MAGRSRSVIVRGLICRSRPRGRCPVPSSASMRRTQCAKLSARTPARSSSDTRHCPVISVRGDPLTVDDGRIRTDPSFALALDAIADADRASEASRHPHSRIAWKRAGGPDHRFIFKNDRAAHARDADAPAAIPGKRNTASRGGGHTRLLNTRPRTTATRQSPFVRCPFRFRLRRDLTGGAPPTEILK